jgi:hypothetical protein
MASWSWAMVVSTTSMGCGGAEQAWSPTPRTTKTKHREGAELLLISIASLEE